MFPALLGCLLVMAGASVPAASTPTARIDYALCDYPPAQGLLMHGGWGPDGKWNRLSEMWQLDPSGWRLMAGENSPAFSHHSMVYDAARQLVVLCGQPEMMNSAHEIWEFDGARWTKTFSLPSTDFGDAELAFDPLRQRVLLYRASMDLRAETWEGSGAGWQKMTPAQNPKAVFDGALLEFDPNLRQCVLVAGGESDAETQTWLWDGAQWTRATGAQPAGALTGGLAFDQARQKLVLLSTAMSTWTFDGVGWAQLQPARSPPYQKLGYFALEYDATRQRCTFFSGEGAGGVYPTQTWDWDGLTWAEFSPGAVTPEVKPTLAFERGAAGTARLAWPADAAGYQLECSPALGTAAAWSLFGATPQGSPPTVTVPLTHAAQFFRLRKP